MLFGGAGDLDHVAELCGGGVSRLDECNVARTITTSSCREPSKVGGRRSGSEPAPQHESGDHSDAPAGYDVARPVFAGNHP